MIPSWTLVILYVVQSSGSYPPIAATAINIPMATKTLCTDGLKALQGQQYIQTAYCLQIAPVDARAPN